MRLPCLALALAGALPAVAAEPLKVELATLTPGQRVGAFTTAAVYTGAGGRPMGARFRHARTGFTLDLLQIESVPQGYTWVNSFPVGDQGEPHTQEHLLLGKGTRGRAFSGLDTMWLSSSTAFTQQWRTSYHFNTGAGPDVFFDLLGAQLDALLHPNYTDEEIRREVRHFGVAEDGSGGLRLEEKGSVYNEMTSSTAHPSRVVFRVAGQLVYGPEHPLSYNSGGEPSGIRTMKPEDIRRFHAANYYLGNMGTIAAFPSSVPLGQILERVDAILARVDPEGPRRPPATDTPVPPPQPAPAGRITVAEYPHRNDQQPSPVALLWPADRTLSAEDAVLFELFASAFAGDATTNLYKLFVDSRTRVLDTGATAVWASVDRDPGHSFIVGFTNVAAANLTEAKLGEVRALVVKELEKVAGFADGSPELLELNARVQSRITERERDLAKFVNTPPSFGFRGVGSDWMDQLLLLETTSGFQKSLTLEPQVKAARAAVASGKNIWREALERWRITGVAPFVAAARPSPAFLQKEQDERAARAEAEAQRLARAYGEADAQAAIKRYAAEYEAESRRIEAEAKQVAPPPFVKAPPLTLDDPLQFRAGTLGGVPLVTSTFESMTSATLGLALRADGLPREDLRYLSLLPALLTRVGVIEDGKPVPYEEMSERLRQEILDLNASFSNNGRTGRVELVLRGSGLGQAEFERALRWMSLALHHPDWRPENLPRLRDVVEQSLSALRNTMQGAEEGWVQNPSEAWRWQASGPWLAADSFLTRTHNALRLKWLLREVPAAEQAALGAFLDTLAAPTGGRAALKSVLAAGAPDTLPEASRLLARDLLNDLDQTLTEVPDATLAEDWTYLTAALREDLFTPPAGALARLDEVRKKLLRASGARFFLVSSSALERATTAKVAALAASLDAKAPALTPAATTARLIDTRLGARAAGRPVHVGLFAPNMQGGVIITGIPSAHFADHADREKQLDFLASRLFAGAGAHGIFLKTLAAGLAYSNGLRGRVSGARIGYYAERTPEIPQTVQFVVNTLKAAERDPRLADYAVAQVFNESRAAASYEARAEGMAADLANGQPPEQVKQFRQAVLGLRRDPKLGDLLFDRKDAVYARMLPGYGAVKAKDVAGGEFFAIGPDRQLEAWERYLKQAEGLGTALVRLYPRDFWQP